MNRLALLGMPAIFAILATSAGCRHAPRPAGPAPAVSDALVARELARLSEDLWDFKMAQDPIGATYLADRRFDDRLPDITPEGIQEAREQAKFLLAQAKALDPNALAAQDWLTRAMMISMLEGDVATAVCRDELWDVNALDGIQTQLGELPELHGIFKPEHAASLVTRYQKSGDWIDQHISNLRTGEQEGYRAAKVAVTRVIDQLDAMLNEPPEQSHWVLGPDLPDDFTGKMKADTQAALATAVKDQLYPALRRYRAFLQNEYLPQARDKIGVEQNKNGAACYRAKILQNTHLTLSPEEIHQIGLTQAAQNLADMKAIAKKLTGSEDLEALEAHLAQDPAQHVQTREEVVARLQGVIDRAEAKVPELFGVLPKQRVEVKPIEEFREASSPMGYYYPASEAEGRPGYFYVNTHSPQTQPMYLFESLAFHEAVPGHHLQGAIAQELTGLPRFRRELGDGAYTEGWAHYAELLADEAGLYSGDAARFGMLSDQALRAVRLVVDTGMHHLGWSREKALDYMLTHTAEPRDDAEREIDRYIVWPGQALCYKLGQLEILKLRAEAEQKLGSRFDLKRFHDAVLGNGALPLPVLDDAIHDWLKREASSPAAGASSAPGAEASPRG